MMPGRKMTTRIGGEPLVFWKDSAVLLVDANEQLSPELRGCPCIDPHYRHALNRYGYFSKETYTWEHEPVGDFPKEFRTAALLLGYS